jgi:hypothetical protein
LNALLIYGLILGQSNGQEAGLIGGEDSYDRFTWRPTSKDPQIESPCGLMTNGDWVDLKKDDLLDLDIIVGERLGGGFGAWFLVEKEGVEYPKDKEVRVIPVFQIAPIAEPFKGRASSHTINTSIWKCYQ